MLLSFWAHHEFGSMNMARIAGVRVWPMAGSLNDLGLGCTGMVPGLVSSHSMAMNP